MVYLNRRLTIKEALRDPELHLRIAGLANKKYYGNEYLFRLISVFEPDDLIHDFWVNRSQRLIKAKHATLWVSDFAHYITDVIRNAKKRYRIGGQLSFSDYSQRNNEIFENFLFHNIRRRV